MSDLIERQAAIDVMLTALDDDWESDYAKDRMRELPSAQPDITRCKECVNYDTSWIPHSVQDRYYCITLDSFMPEDGYCNYAERRTDG